VNAEIEREDFGLTWNVALEAGGFLVGKKVKIHIEGELIGK
jgi:polyisoprenoid-binding protein YceI